MPPINATDPQSLVLQAMLKFRPVYIDRIILKASDGAQLQNDLQYIRGDLDGSLKGYGADIPAMVRSDQAQDDIVDFKVDWEFGANTALLLPIDSGVSVSITAFPSADQRKRKWKY